jgi:glycosyltransferase involved in cell wall biosynthesis
MAAGIRTHYENVSHVVAARPDVAATRVEIHPWRDGGNIERLPLLSQRVRSTLRTYWETAPLLGARPVDVVWSQIVAPTLPFLFTSAALRHIPVVFDVDSTPRLLARFGEHYAEQVAGPTIKRRALDALVGAAARRSAAIVCWSEWAARSYVADYGVLRERVRVIPPGVNVETWAPPVEKPPRGDRLRLLFVGVISPAKGAIC